MTDHLTDHLIDTQVALTRTVIGVYRRGLLDAPDHVLVIHDDGHEETVEVRPGDVVTQSPALEPFPFPTPDQVRNADAPHAPEWAATEEYR
jgi:hypothetical protein